MAQAPMSRSATPGRIAGVTISGYKSIRDEQSLEIRPLTVLAGANSSGKSSLIQPLLLMKQTLEASYDPGPLLLNGPNVKFTSLGQLFSSAGRRTVNDFTVSITTDRGVTLRTTFARQASRELKIQSMTVRRGNSEYSLDQDMKGEQVPEVLTDPRAGLPPGGSWMIVRDRCFLAAAIGFEKEAAPPIVQVRPAAALSTELRSIVHLPGLRGNPERAYPVAAVGSTFPGTFESYTASVIDQWQRGKQDTLKLLGSDMERIGLTWKVSATRLNDTQVKLQVGRLTHAARGGANDLVDIADVGFGVSQTLPVLVALRVTRPGQLVYLEQPEIHLHPRAQVAMAEVLADAARRGIRVVVETHSSLLLRGIQTLVAQGSLSPSLVKLHWFSRSEDDGFTTVSSSNLDNEGAFGDWPVDFDEVMLRAEQNYLDAAEQRGDG